MKLCKRLLIYTCFVAVLSLTFGLSTVKADEAGDYYNKLFSTSAAPYMMTCQPDSAIVLSDDITITEEMQSPNYFGGVADLPRLAADYYYAIDGSSDFYVGETVYPILCWKDSAVDKSATLSIKSTGEDRVVASFTVKITDQTMHGVDYWYPSAPIMSEDDEDYVVIPERDFEDCSYEMVQLLVNAGNNLREYSNGPELYDAAMHQNSIVMDNYVYTPNDKEYDSMSGISYETTSSFDARSYVFSRYDTSSSDGDISYNIKAYLGTLDSECGSRAGLLFAGSKFENCKFDTNTGNCSTTIRDSDSDNLYYFIALSSRCYFGKVTTDTVSTSDLSQTDVNAPSMVWYANQYYDLESGSIASNGGFTDGSVGDYDDFGPVSYDSFYRYADKNFGVSMRSGRYSFMHSNKETRGEMNVFFDSLIYDGCKPHFATTTVAKALTTVTVNYYYRAPSDAAGTWRLLESDNYASEEFTKNSLESLPDYEYYTPTAWYTDTAMSKEFDISLVDMSSDVVLNLYAGYTYSGGYYEVVFYNNISNSESSGTFRIDQKPTLPENPEASAGYQFKYWAIVESRFDDTGTAYSPDSFTPVVNSKYIFKTMWDVQGIITKVLTSKVNYYVGDKIDTSKLQVWVQDSNDVNDTRILEEDEYSINGRTIKNIGTNQFTITYKATGATAICEVNGIEKVPMSIKATYKGGDVVVGSKLKESDFSVVLTYNSGDTENISDFTISPKTVKSVGDNVISVSYTEYKTEVHITGIEDTSSKKSLKSISASFTGKQPYVGDSIKADDLLVTAFYSDNSSKTLESTAFKFSPSKFSTAGSQTIVVTYSGLSTPVSVNVREVSTGDNGNGNNSNNSSNVNNQNNSNNSNNNNSGSNSGNNNSSGNNSSSNNGNNQNTGNTTTGSSSSHSQSSTSTSGSNSSSGSSSSSGTSTSTSTSNKNNGNGTTVTSSNSSDGKGTSPGYLHAANILTNTMGLANATATNVVDISEMLDTAEDKDSVYLTLTNGNNGNDITPEMLSTIKSKSLSLYIDMVSNQDNQSVATWLISGELLDDTSRTINPNITFEVTDKDTERLVYFATANSTYPAGCSLSVYPMTSCYGSGELVRLYTCDISLNNSKLMQTLTWQDSVNSFVIDIYDNNSFCLSNAALVYEDGESLLLDKSLPSVDTTVEDSTEIPSESVEDTIEAPLEDSTQNNVITVENGLPKWLLPAIIAGAVLLAAICAISAIVISKKGKNRMDSDDYDSDSDEDDLDFDIEESSEETEDSE